MHFVDLLQLCVLNNDSAIKIMIQTSETHSTIDLQPLYCMYNTIRHT